METLFSVKNISKFFPDASGTEMFTALDNINLDIYEGQCLLISGSNGSGKTLLMRIIAGLMSPDAGEVFYRGIPMYDKKRKIRRETERCLRRELGLVFQDADSQIVGETVMEDVLFGPENLGFDSEKAKKAAEQALVFMGLDKRTNDSPRRLSGGEKRRLAVAGILAMGCGTVIMDEPFANLDWPGVVQTLKMINDLKISGKTIIILTHSLEKVLDRTDRLVIIHKGKICGDGFPGDILDSLDPVWGVRDPRDCS